MVPGNLPEKLLDERREGNAPGAGVFLCYLDQLRVDGDRKPTLHRNPSRISQVQVCHTQVYVYLACPLNN